MENWEELKVKMYSKGWLKIYVLILVSEGDE